MSDPSANLSGINLVPGPEDDGWVGPPPVTLDDGSVIQLYKDGEAMRHMYRAIERARLRICLEVYIFRDDRLGRAMAALLASKAREGLFVYLLCDGFGSDWNAPIFREMRSAGVHMARFHPIWPWQCTFSWRPVNRDHRKLLVVDGDIGGLGGLNIGEEYEGGWVIGETPITQPWRDNAIGIRGPAARHLLAAFRRTWLYVHRGGRIARCQYLHLPTDADFGLLGSVPTMHSPIVRTLRQLFRQAESSIELTMAYFAPPPGLVEELCAAARRGVRVRLMLPGVTNHPIVRSAGRAFFRRMLDAGVEIYERQGAVLHAKSLCIDRRISVIGSTNLDYRSIEFNLEVSALIRSPALGQAMGELFENDVKFARRIDPREWKLRPTYDRAVQWAVNRLRYFL